MSPFFLFKFMNTLQNIKICGITQPHTARFVAGHGIGAVGFIFYSRSPRFITPDHACLLSREIKPYNTASVGVFADAPLEEVIKTAEIVNLSTIQLHGNETAEYAQTLADIGYRVIKVLKTAGAILIDQASRIPADIGIMVEAGNGSLPGGNGALWNWEAVYELSKIRQIAIAGGITPDNIMKAAANSGAAALDVSSGVEDKPGIKNHDKISELIKNTSGLSRSVQFWK